MLKFVRSRLAGLLLLGVLYASVVAAQMLNSERIEQTFGSYGIEVLYSDETSRLSNLYSEHDGQFVTRTLAIVEYPTIVDQAFAAEHQAILDGGSIGATFKAAGWEVIKRNLSIFEASAAPIEFANLMGVETTRNFASHFYQLDIERSGRRFTYATIAEMHHPDYLSSSELMTIYPLDIDQLRADQPDSLPEREEYPVRHVTQMSEAFRKLRALRLPLRQ